MELIDNKRARDAQDLVKRWKAAVTDPKAQRSLNSLLKSLPSLIQANGLGATLAYLKTRDDNQNAKRCFDGIGTYLKPHLGSGDDPLEAITQADNWTYLRAEAEAIAFLRWVREFGRVHLKREGDEEPSPTSVPSGAPQAATGTSAGKSKNRGKGPS